MSDAHHPDNADAQTAGAPRPRELAAVRRFAFGLADDDDLGENPDVFDAVEAAEERVERLENRTEMLENAVGRLRAEVEA